MRLTRATGALFIVFLILTINNVRAQQPAPTPTPEPNENNPSLSEIIIQTNLHSAILNEERRTRLTKSLFCQTPASFPMRLWSAFQTPEGTAKEIKRLPS